MACDYPAIVEGYETSGNKYSENARLANLSAGGLYMWTQRSFEPGVKLSVTILLANPAGDEPPPRLATKGVVMRTEPQTDGSYGIALKFNHYRFQ
jgi:hypothetical protein